MEPWPSRDRDPAHPGARGLGDESTIALGRPQRLSQEATASLTRQQLAQRLHDDRIEPGAAARPSKEVAGPDYCGAQPRCGTLAQRLFDCDTDTSLARARILLSALEQ